MTFAGGKGANQSVAIARAGGAVTHCGCIGSDGGWLRDKLGDAGVDISGIRSIDTHPTGHAVIQVTNDGQNAIVIFAGANHAFDDEQIERAASRISSRDYVLIQNETNAVARIMQAAAKQGASVWFNPAPFGLAVNEYPLDLVNCLIVNETEAAGLTGSEVNSRDLDERLESRAASGQAVVLTRGAAGATCWQNGQRIDVKAPVVSPADTTAAGDTFIGYLLAAVSQGLAMQDAMSQAVVAASLCVTKPGAMDAIPTSVEVAKHLQQ